MGANCRRHEIVSPTSVTAALLVNVFSEVPNFATLYWFCGYHISGPNSGALGIMRRFICQLLTFYPIIECDLEESQKFDGKDLEKLCNLFKRIFRQMPNNTVVVCIIDGISYYEDQCHWKETCKVINQLVKLMKAEYPILKLLLTSPTRTSRIHQASGISKYVIVVDIPSHVDGARQGFNHRAVTSGLSESLEESQKL